MAVASPTLRDPGSAGSGRGYRRAIVMAGFAGAAGLVALSVVGHWVAGVFLIVGLAAGVWNASRLHDSAPVVLADGVVHRRALSSSGLRRLGYITLLVIACAVAFRPEGWTVAVGLAVFQILLVVNTAVPLLREVRRG